MYFGQFYVLWYNKKVKRLFAFRVFLVLLLTLSFTPGIAAQEQNITALIAQIQKSLNLKDFPSYLENFSEEIRAREESNIKRKFNQFEVDSVTLFRSGRVSQVGDEAKVYLQALFQNSYSVSLENWSLSLVKTEGQWAIADKKTAGTLSNLYKIKIPTERAEKVKSVEIEHVDIKLSFKDPLLFYDNIPEVETALLIIGKGRLQYSPSEPRERHQLDLIYKRNVLHDDLSYAYLRCSNYFFQEKIKIEKDPGVDKSTPTQLEMNKAYALFTKHYSRSFTVENSLNGELYSTLPQGDEVVIDFNGKKLGDFTYIYSPFSDEEVHLFRWKDEKLVNLYSPPSKEKQRKLFVTLGEMFKVNNYQIDIDFNPKQFYISGKARVEVESKMGSLERVKFKLNPNLEILRIYDGDMRELFYSRDKLREFLYVYLISPPPQKTPYALDIYYRGKVVPLRQIEDVVQFQRNDTILFTSPKYETYLYSRRSFWYPSPPDDDYFQARLRIIIPPGYGCISNGEMVEQTRINGVERVEEVDKVGSSVYIFETKYPVKYLSFIAGEITRVKEDSDSLPLKLYSSSGIYFQNKGLLDEAKKILQFYQEWFGPYPYEKLSIIQRNWASAGGHSPASFIVLNELAKSAEGGAFTNVSSPVDLSRWDEYFIAHEIAHQWWGQGVTWKKYHDQWLSEGLAQFASMLYLKENRGEGAFSYILKKFSSWTEKYSHWGPITLGSRLSFFNFKAYQSIIYDKTSLVMNLLKDYLGEEVFFEGLREFFMTYRYGAAGTRDFIKTMERVSGEELTAFFAKWFDSYLLPEVNVTQSLRKAPEGHILELKVVQPKEAFVFPLWIEWIENGEKVRIMVVVDEMNESYEFELKDKPQKIKINPDNAVPGKFY